MDFNFHAILRTLHITAGVLGLVCFWIPIFAKKGGRVHLVAGRVFVRLASVIAATAVVSCIWALAAPIHFSGITRTLTDEEVQVLSANIRFLFALLGLLTTWFVSSMQVGLRAIRTRKDQSKLGDSKTRLLVSLALLASFVSLVGGAYQYLVTNEMRYLAFVGLGAVGMFDGRKMLSVLAKTDHGRMDWWYLHMESMLGLGIAFHTAFFVFGGRQVWGELPGMWAIVPWILPTIIGVTACSIWTNYYRQKFEGAMAADVVVASR